MEALRSSRCRKGDGGSTSGRSCGRTLNTNAITAIASRDASKMIQVSLKVGQILFNLVFILLKRRVVQFHRTDLGQRLRFAEFGEKPPNAQHAEANRRVGYDPSERAGP